MAESDKWKGEPPQYQPPVSSVDPGTHGGYPPAGYPASSQPMGYAAQPSQYPPPPAGYTAANSTVVMTNQPGTAPSGGTAYYRESPVMIVCQFCQATVTTSTYYDTGTLTYLACCGLLIIGCWAGCCLIPFCIDPLKDVTHKCPNCQQTVGHYRRL